MANNDEVRDLVKRLVRERLVEKVGVSNIIYHGEEINMTRTEDGLMWLNLPRLKKSYVVMSGRVYQRVYSDDSGGVMDVADPMPLNATQLNYQGEPEEVNTAIFSNRLICSCGGIRFVKKQDLFQVTKCKPCTIRERSMRRRKKES